MQTITPSISIVLPAFNEEQNLAATVEDAVATLEKMRADYEILVVDDGSTDRTSEVCRVLVARFSRVQVVRHAVNRGYGATLRTGFGAARRDFIFFTDADGQFRFDGLADFLACADDCDMVIGYRAARQDPVHRRFGALLGNRFIRAFLPVHARDINCAYKLLRRESLSRLSLFSRGALINTELLACAAQAGWKWRELPVAHFPRKFGKATGGNARVIWRVAGEFVRLRRRLASNHARG